MNIDRKKWKDSVEKVKSQKILVAGDLILDEYLFGNVNRISPEAPVPVVWVRSEKQTLGGSGNVVKNLSAFGSKSVVIGRSGNDEASLKLNELLLSENPNKMDLCLIKSDKIPTILKTRVIASHQQICRIDKEEIVPLTEKEEKEVISIFETKVKECSAVILSDYDKGFFSQKLIEIMIKISKDLGKVVTVDPQVSHFFQYKNISIMTPNHHEAGKALNQNLITNEEVELGCKEIVTNLNPDAMMITRGDKGMTVWVAKEDQFYHIPTVAMEVFDVTGAGDTVISTYTAFHAAGLSIFESSLVSNTAAGIVVGKLGAATASSIEIENALEKLGYLK